MPGKTRPNTPEAKKRAKAKNWKPGDETDVIEGYRRETKQVPQKKIGILGTCPSRGMAPVNDMSWEFWTIGPGGKNSHRWERLFEIHGNGTWPDGFRTYLEELKAVNPPQIIYTEEAMPDWPANVVYPKQALFAKYGKTWFRSQISYALAMALEENVTDLGVWGVDLESGEEYKAQFEGARFFIDLARLAGINVYLPKGCGLLREPNPYPEGWETHLAGLLDSKIQYLGSIVAEKRGLHGQLAAEINHIEGEIAMANFLRSVYVLGGADPNDPGPPPEMSIDGKVDMLLGIVRQHGLLPTP